MESLPRRILPVGTQVVTRAASSTAEGRVPRGAVGIVTRAPVDLDHAYRVRFADGTEISVRASELTVRKEFQREEIGAGDPGSWEPLRDHIIYRCVVGSRAYGLDVEASDIDRRGIYLPPAALHWSLHGVPEQIEFPDTQECYWEIRKFLVLALKANPNVLECLYTPLVESATPLAGELLAQRSIFLSRLVYQTYNGYVLSQFKKLGQDLRTRGTIRWKHAMHLVRLLLAGITILDEGFVPLRVDAHRERLLAIRRGEVPWDEIDAWRLDLHRAFEAAFRRTKLPDRPDYERADAFLVRARRTMARQDPGESG